MATPTSESGSSSKWSDLTVPEDSTACTQQATFLRSPPLPAVAPTRHSTCMSGTPVVVHPTIQVLLPQGPVRTLTFGSSLPALEASFALAAQVAPPSTVRP